MNLKIDETTMDAENDMEEAIPAKPLRSADIRSAVEILKRGPGTLEDIDAMRSVVFSSPEAWRKFEKHVRETLEEEEGDFEERHAVGLAVLGLYEQAEEELEKLERSPVVGCLLARVYQETGREDRAVEILRGIRERVPEVPEYRILLCKALERAGDLEGFRKELEILEQMLPDHADTLFLKGLSLEKEGEYEAAKRLYGAAVEAAPRHTDATFRLGLRADMEGDDEKAIELYKRAASTGIPNLAALINLGVLYEDRESYKEAVSCYELARSFYPGNFRARRYLQDARASLEMYYDEEKERKEDKQSQILKIPVSDFELSVRSRNCLAKMDIQTLGDLIKKTEAELLAFKNFGETSLMEIKEILASKGLRLGMLTTDSVEMTGAPASPEQNAVDELILKKNIDDLDLSVRSRSCLTALNIKTLGQLANTSEQLLISQKNFGQTSLNEIRKKLADYGLSLNV